MNVEKIRVTGNKADDKLYHRHSGYPGGIRTTTFAKMQELMAQARTIFLVSHALGSVVDLCNDAIWLQKGQLVRRGEPKDIVDAYTDSLKVKRDAISMEDL